MASVKRGNIFKKGRLAWTRFFFGGKLAKLVRQTAHVAHYAGGVHFLNPIWIFIKSITMLKWVHWTEMRKREERKSATSDERFHHHRQCENKISWLYLYPSERKGLPSCSIIIRHRGLQLMPKNWMNERNGSTHRHEADRSYKMHNACTWSLNLPVLLWIIFKIYLRPFKRYL